jgi:tRNA-Thr(GGU) m(6)t(6)A37 methyltransferase TsaA
VVTVDDVNRTFDVWPIGRVESTLTDLARAPRQADEGAPTADVVIHPAYFEATVGLAPGDEIVLVTWLDRGDRAVLKTRPRGDLAREPVGVFATRSPDRPNPIGLHTVRLVAVAGTRLSVEHLEAVDGTPVLDIKPVLGSVEQR